ncbi:Serine/threonine-protein phosphatase 7 long form-like [Glycine soja]|uniref:Serine/threonine-protein phosphatase 7 long form-like n=2 Tax=Glycine soja TaxID=3848 RepID=A0A445F219_GLYSO|nr:Serine/threonine-protein phosphatase 7 long form-like [Glycine soja]
MVMHGATTTGAFDRDEPRGFGSAIPTSASPFADVALEAPALMASWSCCSVKRRALSCSVADCSRLGMQRRRGSRDAPLGIASCMKEASFPPAICFEKICFKFASPLHCSVTPHSSLLILPLSSSYSESLVRLVRSASLVHCCYLDSWINDIFVVMLIKFTRAWILRFIGGVLFVNKSSSRVSLRWLRRGNQHIDNDDLRVFRRKLDLMKRHEFVWEPYTATVMAALPPICVVGSVAWFAVVPLICFHVVEWHQPDRVLQQFGLQQPIPGCPSQPQNLHGITLKGKQDENWFHLLAPIISQWNNRAEFRVDVYLRQEGLLGFNSDYMVWYRRKTKMFVDPNNANTTTLGEVVETLQYMVSPQGRNTWTVDDLVPYVEKLAIISEEQERITEPVSHGPASECEFPAQEFHILQSSVETRGIGRRREPVEAEQYSQQMMERGHGMYYMPATFSQYPSQMYQYPFEGHHTDTSANEHSFGGVAEKQPHFSWPTMTPPQQHDAPMATPNAPFAPQWNVPGAILDMGDLLGVDLR